MCTAAPLLFVTSLASSHALQVQVNAAGIEGGSAIKVGDLALNMAEGDDARLQLCYEPERIMEQRLGEIEPRSSGAASRASLAAASRATPRLVPPAPAHSPPTPSPPLPPPDEGETGEVQYLVKWKHCPPESNTWEYAPPRSHPPLPHTVPEPTLPLALPAGEQHVGVRAA